MEQIIRISEFILSSFVHIWPYLLISIPLAVIVQMTGVSKYINRALSKNPIVAILLATIVGAFSPFCSCGVIPIITSLLIGGVPIAPVMSFWIASPSMDPEIFFLSVATIGWKLSVWRLVSTFSISLFSGYFTHLAILKGIIGKEVIRTNQTSTVLKPWKFIAAKIMDVFRYAFKSFKFKRKAYVQFVTIKNTNNLSKMSCCIEEEKSIANSKSLLKAEKKASNCCEKKEKTTASFKSKLSKELWKATSMVIKFMALAFFINALINFYVPQDFISNILGKNGSFSIVIATLIGIPAYTSNITALPLVSGLISLGMNPGAALAFLIAGPTTTLPAMLAVWGIVKKRIFLLYISYSLIGAVIFGLLYNFMN